MPAAPAHNQACLSCRGAWEGPIPLPSCPKDEVIISLPWFLTTLAIWPSNIRPRRSLSTRMLLSGVAVDIEIYYEFLTTKILLNAL